MAVVAAAAAAALGAWVVRRRANRYRGAFIGYCSAGLERRAAEEVESLPGGTVLAAWRPAGNGRAVMGTVLFRLEDPTLVLGLRAFQQVEALVAVSGGLPGGREDGPAFIYVRSRPLPRVVKGLHTVSSLGAHRQEIARRGCWPEALDLMRRVVPAMRDMDRPVCRAVALRNGSQDFTSPQAAAMAGGAAHIGGGLPIKMRGYDIVVRPRPAPSRRPQPPTASMDPLASAAARPRSPASSPRATSTSAFCWAWTACATTIRSATASPFSWQTGLLPQCGWRA